MTPATSSSSLTIERYLDLLRADMSRLREVGDGDLTAAVPPCPGWTLADVLHHTAEVYLHKVESMRTGSPPDPWPPDDFVDREPREFFTDASAQLLHELETRDPDEPSWTWVEADQQVGFWHRRMTQETAVHRVDGELAAAEVTPIDRDLAADGVDEVLRLMLGGPWWTMFDTTSPIDARVRVSTGDRSWTATCSATSVTIDERDGGGVAATVSGEPHDVLLWLWGRVDDQAVQLDGDPTVVAALRQRLVEATQ